MPSLPCPLSFPPKLRLLAATGAGLWPTLALAAEGNTAIEPAGGLLQVMFGLILVALLLAGSLYLLKRLGTPHGSRGGLLRVISATPVGPRERVVVVEAGSTWLVLGVTAGQINKLHELPRPAGEDTAPPPPPVPDFSAWLRQFMERRNAP